MAERMAMPVTMPGSASGSISMNEIGFLAKEVVAIHGRGRQRSEDQRRDGCQRSHAQGERQRRLHVRDCAMACGIHFRVSPGGGKL